MSADANRSLVRRCHEEVVHTGDTSSISEFLAENDAEVHDGKRHPIGIAGSIEHGGAANLLDPLMEIGAIRIVNGSPSCDPASSES